MVNILGMKKLLLILLLLFPVHGAGAEKKKCEDGRHYKLDDGGQQSFNYALATVGCEKGKKKSCEKLKRLNKCYAKNEAIYDKRYNKDKKAQSKNIALF